MRTKRNAYGVLGMKRNYAGYGIERAVAKRLIEECKAGRHAELLHEAARHAAPGLEKWIILSIMEGKSFDRMAVRWELGETEKMPCCRNSFYTYRKFTIAILYRMLSGKEAV